MTICACIAAGVLLAFMPKPAVPASTEISDRQLSQILTTLDDELELRDKYIARRIGSIDSLKSLVRANGSTPELLMQVGCEYIAFNNDSAIHYLSEGLRLSEDEGDSRKSLEFILRRAPLLPQAGFISEGIAEFSSVDTTGLTPELKRLYFASGKNLYKYVASLYPNYPDVRQSYDSVAIACQRQIAEIMKNDPELPVEMRAMQLGEFYFMTGDKHKARAFLHEVLDLTEPTDNSYAISASLLSQLAMRDSLTNDALYYLALSAIADTRRATLEVTSLQNLGQQLASLGQIERAHNYLYNALLSAIECRSTSRILQTSQSLPVIESVHRRELSRTLRCMNWLLIFMGLFIIGLCIALCRLRIHIKRQQKLRRNLEESNRMKEIYISRVLDLCSVYMDKIHQFCHIVSSMISAGQVDELYRLTTSGKFVENQSADFYNIFDEAFLHIYPGFIENVNRLLKPECRFELRKDEKLNTDLRILAFMRLGIDDSARISHILNYSINTIYTYRNKIRNRAINRDTFEQDILTL